MSETISVIIPVYNRNHCVGRAIRSVIEQDYHEIEIIVVDDGSTPPLELSDDLIANGKVKVVRLEKNQGPSAARNAGVKASCGQWLAWLDSDDIWHRKKLSLQMSFLANLGAEKELISLATGFEYAHQDQILDTRIPVPSSDLLYFFAGCWFCPGSTVMLHRSLFDRIGPYDETLRRLEDIDWFIRLAMSGGRLEVVPKVLTTISVGEKPQYQNVKYAGDSVLAKYRNASLGVKKSALDNLKSYLELIYAASAFKRERHFLKGVYHLATSFFIRPRAHLQLYHFWNEPEL